ncbi:mitochondrial adenine nucleotide transporter ADNT1-like protein [Tanacetum coccineum]
MERIGVHKKTEVKGNFMALPAATWKCCACAGIIAMSSTYPMDLVRGQITVQTDKSSSRYRGIAHALRTVLCEECNTPIFTYSSGS